MPPKARSAYASGSTSIASSSRAWSKPGASSSRSTRTRSSSPSPGLCSRDRSWIYARFTDGRTRRRSPRSSSSTRSSGIGRCITCRARKLAAELAQHRNFPAEIHIEPGEPAPRVEFRWLQVISGMEALRRPARPRHAEENERARSARRQHGGRLANGRSDERHPPRPPSRDRLIPSREGPCSG